MTLRGGWSTTSERQRPGFGASDRQLTQHPQAGGGPRTQTPRLSPNAGGQRGGGGGGGERGQAAVRLEPAAPSSPGSARTLPTGRPAGRGSCRRGAAREPPGVCGHVLGVGGSRSGTGRRPAPAGAPRGGGQSLRLRGASPAPAPAPAPRGQPRPRHRSRPPPREGAPPAASAGRTVSCRRSGFRAAHAARGARTDAGTVGAGVSENQEREELGGGQRRRVRAADPGSVHLPPQPGPCAAGSPLPRPASRGPRPGPHETRGLEGQARRRGSRRRPPRGHRPAPPGALITNLRVTAARPSPSCVVLGPLGNRVLRRPSAAAAVPDELHLPPGTGPLLPRPVGTCNHYSCALFLAFPSPEMASLVREKDPELIRGVRGGDCELRTREG